MISSLRDRCISTLRAVVPSVIVTFFATMLHLSGSGTMRPSELEVELRLSLDCHTYTVQFITVKQSLYSYSGLSLILYSNMGCHSREYPPQLSIITLFQLKYLGMCFGR